MNNKKVKHTYNKLKNNKYTRDLYNLKKSFSYAIKGLKFAIDNERNMRIHLVVSVLVLEFSCLYGITQSQLLVILLLLGIVMSMELVNTAIEAIVNMVTDAYNNFAKIAKDVAAAAVLLMSICAVVVGLIIFSDVQKLLCVVGILVSTPLYVCLGLFELVLSYIFIFRWSNRNKK